MNINYAFSVIIGLIFSVQISAAQDEDLYGKIYVENGVHVDIHPVKYKRDYKFPYTSPPDALQCSPNNQRAACGNAYWDDDPLPLDVYYITRVPAVVRLDGPAEDVIFTPFVHCIINDKDGRRISADAPDVDCITRMEHEGDYLRWTFGGTVTPQEGLPTGTYTGSMNVHVTDEETKWDFLVPIEVNVPHADPECWVPILELTKEITGLKASEWEKMDKPVTFDVPINISMEKPTDQLLVAEVIGVGMPRPAEDKNLFAIPGLKVEATPGTKNGIRVSYQITTEKYVADRLYGNEVSVTMTCVGTKKSTD